MPYLSDVRLEYLLREGVGGDGDHAEGQIIFPPADTREELLPRIAASVPFQCADA